MTTIKTLAAAMSNSFTALTRTNGDTIRILEEGSPTWMRDIVFACHDDGRILPDDTVYAFVEKCCDVISENVHDDTSSMFDDCIEAIYSYAEPDIETYKLKKWLLDSPDASGYVDEALQGEYNVSAKDMTLDSLLMFAQKQHIDAIGILLINALQEHIEKQGE